VPLRRTFAADATAVAAAGDDVFVTMDAMHLKWNQRLTTAVVQAQAFNRMGFLRAERSE